MTQLYKKTSTANLNKQNAHIAIAYELVNAALMKLMSAGITVIRVTIEGSCPMIEVMPSKGCDSLEGYVHAVIRRPSQRVNIKRANINHCVIQWETRDLH